MHTYVSIILANPTNTQSSNAATWTPAVIIASCALLFTVASFWWLNVRRGNLKSFEPFSFAAVVKLNIFRLRFPLVFHNTGAVPIVIQNLQIKFLDEPGAAPLPWVATRSHIKPESDDGHAFPAVFSVAGRAAVQTFQEFGAPSPGFKLGARDYRVRLEAKLGHEKEWNNILTFTLRTWRIDYPENFITYENSPGSIAEEKRRDVETGLDFAQMGRVQGSAENGSDNPPQ